MSFLLLMGNLFVETNMPTQAAGEDVKPAQIPQMLKSPKFWLVTYALFGKPLRCLMRRQLIPPPR